MRENEIQNMFIDIIKDESAIKAMMLIKLATRSRSEMRNYKSHLDNSSKEKLNQMMNKRNVF